MAITEQTEEMCWIDLLETSIVLTGMKMPPKKEIDTVCSRNFIFNRSKGRLFQRRQLISLLLFYWTVSRTILLWSETNAVMETVSTACGMASERHAMFYHTEVKTSHYILLTEISNCVHLLKSKFKARYLWFCSENQSTHIQTVALNAGHYQVTVGIFVRTLIMLLQLNLFIG